MQCLRQILGVITSFFCCYEDIQDCCDHHQWSKIYVPVTDITMILTCLQNGCQLTTHPVKNLVSNTKENVAQIPQGKSEEPTEHHHQCKEYHHRSPRMDLNMNMHNIQAAATPRAAY